MKTCEHIVGEHLQNWLKNPGTNAKIKGIVTQELQSILNEFKRQQFDAKTGEPNKDCKFLLDVLNKKMRGEL